MKALRGFFTLGAIIGGLPNNIIDGQAVDAVPVMANFNFIVAQVNANAAAVSALPSGFVPVYAGTAGGTGNAIALTPGTPIVSYAAGQRFTFTALSANSTAVTVNVSALGAKTLLTRDNKALSGEEIRAGALCEVIYDGTNFFLLNGDSFDVVLPWTPALAFGGSTVGITYAAQSGNYMKIGRMVEFWGQMLLTNKGGTGGLATIQGLPYAINTLTSGLPSATVPVGLVQLNSVSFTGGYVNLIPASLGGGSLEFAATSSGIVGSVLNDTNFTNGSTLFFSGRYPT